MGTLQVSPAVAAAIAQSSNTFLTAFDAPKVMKTKLAHRATAMSMLGPVEVEKALTVRVSGGLRAPAFAMRCLLYDRSPDVWLQSIRALTWDATLICDPESTLHTFKSLVSRRFLHPALLY